MLHKRKVDLDRQGDVTIGNSSANKTKHQSSETIFSSRRGATKHQRKSRSLVQDSETLMNRQGVIQGNQYMNALTFDEGMDTLPSVKGSDPSQALEIRTQVGSESYPNLMGGTFRQLGTR